MKKILSLLVALSLVTACGASDSTVIKPITFRDLAGWQNDNLAAPFGVFAESCQANEKRGKAYQSKSEGPVGVRQNWQRACQQAALLGQPSDALARRFFETNFTPYKIETESQPKGLITGYYEPIINGSKVKKAPYLTPVYGVPSDLHKPYLTREQIVRGDIRGHAPVLFYVDDPVLLFFLHVQGSGKVRMPDGSLMGLQYAAQNGYPYTPIGKILKDRGELTALSMQSIRSWLLAHPDQMDAVMNQNQSYVFFKHSPGDKVAKGALGLSLTPLRSIAVDDDRAAYGVPTYLDTTQSEYPTAQQIPLQRLMVSQDTGGALKGPHRADVFYGQGTVQEWQAGHQSTRANVYWLLPVGTPAEIILPMAEPSPDTLDTPEMFPAISDGIGLEAAPPVTNAPVVVVPGSEPDASTGETSNPEAENTPAVVSPSTPNLAARPVMRERQAIITPPSAFRQAQPVPSSTPVPFGHAHAPVTDISGQ